MRDFFYFHRPVVRVMLVCLSALVFMGADCTFVLPGVTIENTAPVADAGPDQLVLAGDFVTLDGSESFDPDGDALFFTWVQTEGPEVILDTPDEPVAVFLADLPDTYVFELTVEDEFGAIDTSEVVIDAENTAPVADAGLDQLVPAGDFVTLDGSDSFDPDGDALFFTWIQTEGPEVILDTPDEPVAVFLADLPDTYVFELTVEDEFGDFDTSEVIIDAF